MLKEVLLIILGIIALGLIVFVVSGNLKKSVKVMSGWGIYEAWGFFFDFILWPILQAFYGFLGIILLILMALILNFIVLLWYQRHKVDWFGVNVLEDIKTKGHLWVHKVDNHESVIKKVSLYIPAKILQFMIWLLNKNDIFAFVTLSLWQDSFITTIFLRHGRFDKLDKRDYIIFISSTILSCIGWAILMQVIIIAAKAIWGLF
jgi:hypothetical protein